MRGDPVKGHLDTLVLASLSRGPTHGYGLIGRLRELSDGAFDFPEGTIYPVLHRLERAGKLASSWSEGTGRARRVYALTPAGEAALADGRAQWERFARTVAAVLGGAS
jgi:DNA-binding PadR family transcriptional regulator